MPRPALQSWHVLKNKSRYRLLFLTLLISLAVIIFTLVKTTTPKLISQPLAIQKSVQQSIQDLQTALYKQPNNVQLASQLARYYLQHSKDKASDRDLYLFLAQETLQIWWDQPNPPIEILSLRAHLYQAQHQFSLARADLQLLLKKQPNHPNAAFSLAMLQQIQGDYKHALQSCKSLLKTRQLMLSSLCQASVQSLNGQAQRAYKILKIFLTQMPVDNQWRQWTLTTLADTANRLGESDAAEQYFQQALAIPTQDSYLKVRYADFLLSQQRANDLLQQFSGIAVDKQLLLRQAYAAKLLPNRTVQQPYAGHLSRYVFAQKQKMQQNTAEYNQHAALWAYYYLHIDQQPKKALLFASMNWQKQKANEDLHLLLQAALLTQDTKTFNIIKKWRKETALDDIALEHLLSTRKLL
jgi:Tfp pilus assembly protein PilF